MLEEMLEEMFRELKILEDWYERNIITLSDYFKIKSSIVDSYKFVPKKEGDKNE